MRGCEVLMSVASLIVNVRVHKVDVDPSCPLLYVLRNNFELNNPRFGCGVGQCGACTVLVDNHAVRSCQLTVANAVGKQIVTLEGLETGGETSSRAGGIHRGTDIPVWLLPERLGDDHQSPARQKSFSERCRNAQRI